MPGKEHPIHDIIKVHKINEKIVENLKVAKYITTTTSIFADEIRKLNKNVVVFPNAINPNEAQFKQPTLESERIRVGWLGGSSHLHDLLLLDGMVEKNGKEINDKIQYVICGFDTRGTMTEINPKTGEEIPISARRVVTFHASQKLKAMVDSATQRNSPQQAA